MASPAERGTSTLSKGGQDKQGSEHQEKHLTGAPTSLADSLRCAQCWQGQLVGADRWSRERDSMRPRELLKICMAALHGNVIVQLPASRTDWDWRIWDERKIQQDAPGGVGETLPLYEIVNFGTLPGEVALHLGQKKRFQESQQERARDYLHKTGRFIVIGGIVSPVHDSYGKQGLVSSRHRLIMCQLAVQNSDWIRVDPWECYQDTWQTTCSVLEHHRDLMKRVTGCILSNVNTPSMTPVIGQPQNETPQPIYQNNNVPTKPTAAKILGKVGESLSRICCVRPPVERFTFVDENANLGTVMRYEEIELRILLLCGSDLLESFCIPGLWNEADVSSKVRAAGGSKYHPRIPSTREKVSRGEKLMTKGQ
ncbi:hypothetical protein HPG69_005490 [Diceros bicornis minor]|uniref:Nicotinamide/nicotinic acid mononucleotide adenylyltransferase 2 n=1 Tax=Diceros bicornis minor TaxID=77932 RepID=A0A7J7ELM4_DICBM|nr:hypothetical protein HPG69_005490 [Diceros bicornis minor]